MVYCRNCGKHIEDTNNFCPYCGAAARTVYPPPPAVPYPTQKDNTLVIIVIVILLFVLVPMVLSGVLYVMVMGFGPGEATPTAAMMAETGDELTFTVMSVSSSVDLNSVVVVLNSPWGESSMGASSGLSDGSNVSKAGVGYYWITFYDTDGNRSLSVGDRVVITSMAGPLADGTYVVSLRNSSVGGTISEVSVQLP